MSSNTWLAGSNQLRWWRYLANCFKGCQAGCSYRKGGIQCSGICLALTLLLKSTLTQTQVKKMRLTINYDYGSCVKNKRVAGSLLVAVSSSLMQRWEPRLISCFKVSLLFCLQPSKVQAKIVLEGALMQHNRDKSQNSGSYLSCSDILLDILWSIHKISSSAMFAELVRTSRPCISTHFRRFWRPTTSIY